MRLVRKLASNWWSIKLVHRKTSKNSRMLMMMRGKLVLVAAAKKVNLTSFSRLN